MKRPFVGYGFVLLILVSGFLFITLGGCSTIQGFISSDAQLEEGAELEETINTGSEEAEENKEEEDQDCSNDFEDKQAKHIDGLKDEWHETKTKTTIVEGMEEKMVLNRFIATNGYFLTYYPDDMLVEEAAQVDGDKGAEVTFFTNFQGQKNEKAFVKFFIYDGLQSWNAIDLEEEVSSWGYELDRNLNPELLVNTPWAEDGGAFSTEEFTGVVYVGEHGDHVFLIKVHYPHEFGDGMHARVEAILEHFYWVAADSFLLE